MEFFLRPFTSSVWILIVALILVIFAILVALFCCRQGFENSDSFAIVATSAWVFFTLVNSYYRFKMIHARAENKRCYSFLPRLLFQWCTDHVLHV